MSVRPRLTTTELGPLRVRVVHALDEEVEPARLVVLCHGFGAPGDDLVPLGPELMRVAPQLASGVVFAFPEAPHALDAMGYPGARAWWPLDAARVEEAMSGRPPASRRDERPDGLIAAREALRTTLGELTEALEVPMDATVLGGFSQGAMLATETTLQADASPLGLVILSGTLLSADAWRRAAARHAGLPVLQSHGRSDPLLSFDESEALAEILRAEGLDVEFLPFDGPHTIPADVLARLGAWLLER